MTKIPSRDTFDDVVDMLEDHDETVYLVLVGYERSSIFHRGYTKFTPEQFRVFRKEVLRTLEVIEKRIGENWA